MWTYALVTCCVAVAQVDSEEGTDVCPPLELMSRAATGALLLWLVCAFVACPLLAGPPTHAEWELTFADEFDGEAVSWDVWASQNGPRGGDKPEGRWPENNVVKDGVLYQFTRRENPPRGGCDWSTAHLWTKEFTQQYGYFEVRMRYGAYLNNAFWLFRPRGRKFPDPPHFEIDINEGHTPGTVNMTLHYYIHPEDEPKGVRRSTGKHWKAPLDLSEQFHVYGVEWDEREIVWSVDGTPIRRLQNPNCHAPVDVRLSTVIMTRHLQRDGVAMESMDGVSMAVDWVRVYRKKRDVRAPDLPELEICTVPRVVSREPQVRSGVRTRVLAEERFESVRTGLPAGWQVGARAPTVVGADSVDPRPAAAGSNGVLRLRPEDYAFCMLEVPVTDRLEVEFDYCTPLGDGLLFVTLGRFDADDPERRATSYYTGDIGPYIHWRRLFVEYYTEAEKWTPFAKWRKRQWNHVRLLLDIGKGVFDCYGGADGSEFLGGGVFRHRQKAAEGIGLRHRGAGGTVCVDNIVVREVTD